jgi:hypothetical protein
MENSEQPDSGSRADGRIRLGGGVGGVIGAAGGLLLSSVADLHLPFLWA